MGSGVDFPSGRRQPPSGPFESCYRNRYCGPLKPASNWSALACLTRLGGTLTSCIPASDRSPSCGARADAGFGTLGS